MQCQEGFLNSPSDFPTPRPPFLGFVEDFTWRDDLSLFHQVQIVWRFTRKFTIVLLVNTNMHAAAWDELHDLTLPKESSLIMNGATTIYSLTNRFSINLWIFRIFLICYLYCTFIPRDRKLRSVVFQSNSALCL